MMLLVSWQPSMTAARDTSAQQVQSLQEQHRKVAEETQEELASAKVSAQQAVHILTGICEGKRDAGMTDSTKEEPKDECLQALLAVLISLASEAASEVQQVQWLTKLRYDPVGSSRILPQT